MSKIKRDHVRRIMDMYFLGHLEKDEMYAMIEAIKRRRDVAVYCRVDDIGDERAQRAALDEQRDKLVQYSSQHGFLVAGVYEDNGMPGHTLERTGLSELRVAYEAGDFDAVLVVDRLVLYNGVYQENLEWGFEVLTPGE